MRKRQLKKLAQRVNYFVGFSGRGTTLLDRLKYSPLTKREQGKWKKDIDILKKVKYNAYRKACIEIMGEDPEQDWI